jgi:hypothetical protein
VAKSETQRSMSDEPFFKDLKRACLPLELCGEDLF